MAWTPSSKVADCRDIANKWGDKSIVIILAVNGNETTLEMATYGKTQALCAKAKHLGDIAYDSIVNEYGIEQLRKEINQRKEKQNAQNP